jgi:3' terminal RNA ribose 2'-O-methyltransferase Hen1
MLLTLTTTVTPATDLGYLLHKNPSRAQSFDLTFGKAHVFYPEATRDRCTAALMLEVDPIALVRRRAGDRRTLEEYVNDRPYVASSFMSVAIGDIFGTAMAGRCKDREALAASELPLEARLAVLPCYGGEAFLRSLFEPLGYVVGAKRWMLDEANPDWGDSPYFTVTLLARRRLADLLTHLYVLIPVLDDDKHYWVGDAEVEKLIRRGEGWLPAHPERDTIVKRYLKHRRSLARRALEQLVSEELPDPDTAEAEHDAQEAQLEGHISLNEQRINAVLTVLKGSGARRVLDLGCGEGNLIRAMMAEKSFEEILAVVVSRRALEIAEERLQLERMPEKQRARIKLLQGSLTYRDRRLAEFDAAAVVEVIEHLDSARLRTFERSLFEFARPGTVVLTTPNVEYNAKFENLPAGELRHRDHRFEWTRAQFRQWAMEVAERFRYSVQFLPVGPEDPALGAPTQMAVFSRLT